MRKTRVKFSILRTIVLCAAITGMFVVLSKLTPAFAQQFVPTQVGSQTDTLGVAGIGASTGLVDADPRIIAAKIIRVALGLLGIIAIGFIIYAGVIWMTAAGDEEKITTAKRILRNAVIGLAIILSSVAITQFIISKLTDAILSSAQKSGVGGGGTCSGDSCFTPEFKIFYATTVPQSPPQLPIKNVVVSIDFFNGLGSPAFVDPATVTDDTVTIVKHGTVNTKGELAPLPAGESAVSYKGELKFIDQNTVEFHPIGSCVDAENPANSNGGTDCFEKNTVYKVTLSNAIKSQSKVSLDCVAHSCVGQFITGEKYDKEPPVVSMAQPGNGALVGNGIATLVGAQISDDAGVKKVAFYENETKNIVDKVLNPYVVSGLIMDETWKPKLANPDKAEVVQLTAKAYDVDNHDAVSSPQTVKILPAWCFDGKVDEGKGEEKSAAVVGAPDCGAKSECGACQGQGCDTDFDCAAGICIPQPGVKVSLADQNTKYKAEGVGLPLPGKVYLYYEWYINGEPLAVVYLPFDKTQDTSKLASNLSAPPDAQNIGQVAHAVVSGPIWGTTYGVIGGAYQFVKPGDYIEAKPLAWKGNQLSIQWWMKRANPTTPKLFVIAAIKDAFSIQTNNKGNISVSVKAGDAPQAALDEQGDWPLPPPDDKWHQVTVVFDGSAIRYYIDGKQDPAAIPFAHIVNASANLFIIGYKGNKGTVAFDGFIDEVRLFTRIINPQQMQAEYDSAFNKHEPADTLDVNIAPPKTQVTADAWQLSKPAYEITNTKAPYRERAGICVNAPKITNVIHQSGAVDNYVTVIGQSFGAYKAGVSKVWFSKVEGPAPAKTDQWALSDACSLDPSKSWHDNYVVVKVPQGAVTGPIKIEAQSSLLPGYGGLTFRDTTADAFGPVFNPKEVFKITTEKLPGLCTIEPNTIVQGDTILKLAGTHLGSGTADGDAVLIGAEEEPLTVIDEWQDLFLKNIKTPATLASGQVSVKLQVKNQKTNVLPLGVKSSKEDTAPRIIDMNPVAGPVGTYVTITGKNFGSGGKVVFVQGKDSFIADLPPAYCGKTWVNQQIVVKTPQSIQNKGDYSVSVIVKQGAAELESNKKIFTVNDEPLSPGLCALEPDNGPLFSAGFGGVTLKGEGFGGSPGGVKFYKDAFVNNLMFFKSWDSATVELSNLFKLDAPAQKKFKTGPVNAVSSQNISSNALPFKIQNCKEEIAKGKELIAVCGEGASCCAAGFCAPQGTCQEEKKPGASVYVWSFTAGKLPVVPKVIEQCGLFCAVSGKPCEKAGAAKGCDENIKNDICEPVTPSPSPSNQWENKEGVCVNADAVVRFDTVLDLKTETNPEAAEPAQVAVLYKCKDEKKCPLDDSGQIIAAQYATGGWSSGGLGGTKIIIDPSQDLQTKTTYGVLITTKAFSFAGALSAAMPENIACPKIAASVEIKGVKGLKAAYCAIFVTRDSKEYCELGSVVVDPSNYSTSEFNKTTTDLYSAEPLAKGNLCIALSGNDYNWAWSPTDAAIVNPSQKKSEYASVSNKTSNKGFGLPKQDLATKNKETPEPEKIWAIWNDAKQNPGGLLKGKAFLTIKLPNPKILQYYPQCTSACVNAEVGALFNTALSAATVKNNTILLEKCVKFDITCKQYAQLSADEYTAQSEESGKEHKIIIQHSALFAPNTYYRVTVKGGADGVKSKYGIKMAEDSLNSGCDEAGKNCTSFVWEFRTKENASPCSVDKVALNPEMATVNIVGAQASYEARGIGAPDACSPNGQFLDTSGSGYAWSWYPPKEPENTDPNSDRAVVWASNFASGEQKTQWCSASCLKAGSAPADIMGLCGNYKIDSGEECDPTEAFDGSKNCGWNCLLYEPKAKGTPACTATTFAQGSCCGNGTGTLNVPPEADEECDLGLQNGIPGSGCTAKCLKEGTSVSYATCIDPAKINASTDVCKTGKTVWFSPGGKSIQVRVRSVCGNSAVEPGEECDLGVLNGPELKSNCSNSCLLQLVDVAKCGDGKTEAENGEACDTKDPATSKGCSGECQKSGSSPLYGSWCGDGSVGAGEACDESAPVGAQHIDAVQYATAVGLGKVTDKKQQGTVSATVAQSGNTAKTGKGKFILECGFAPTNSACPAGDKDNFQNGAGIDSCCYKRPVVSITNPPINVTSNVCPNAVFEVVLKGGEADKQTIPNNVILAEGIKVPSLQPCSQNTVPFDYESALQEPQNWLQKLIVFLKHIFRTPTYAEGVKYCIGDVSLSIDSTYDTSENISTIKLTPEKPLKKNTNYKLIVLNYDKSKGWSGLKDTRGLTFINELSAQDAVTRKFTTANVDFCKVTRVKVEPDYELFTKKDQAKNFAVKSYYLAQGMNPDLAQEVAPVPGAYTWDYFWNTSDASIVGVTDGKSNASVSVKAVGKNGTALITGGVKITTDISKPSSAGSEISDAADVQVVLCENPWPGEQIYADAADAEKIYGIGFIDADTTPAGSTSAGGLLQGKAWNNFQTFYCRDDGKAGDTSDDLPKLKAPAVLYHQDAGDPVLKEFFFTFDESSGNKDSLGLRVYPNLEHKTLSAWYQSQPWIPKGNPVPVKIGQYEALQEGRTVYIAGLNVLDAQPQQQPKAFTNIYVWSYSDNALPATVDVFNQLLANFTLNINVANQRVCVDDSNVSCSKDLDCKDASKGCAAPLDKAMRDLQRIKDLSTLANKVELYKTLNNSYPNLKNNPTLGTFLPGYTNSKWLSWQGVLGNSLNVALPIDPINLFNGCGGEGAVQKESLKDFDAQTCWNASASKFACPKYSYIYEYEFASNIEAHVKANFEWPSLVWKKPLMDSVTNKAVLYIGNSCQNTIIGLSNKCGDGVVGVGEECEIGQTQEFSCLDAVGVPVDWVWNNLHYSKYRVVKCSDKCTWGDEVLQKPKRCKISGKACVKDSDCNPASAGQCADDTTNSAQYSCMPKGYCGDGVVQKDAQNSPYESCDDGPNNGKYGYCSVDCKQSGGGGFCGDGKLILDSSSNPADPNKVCDASALYYNGQSTLAPVIDLWTYKAPAKGKKGWLSTNNLISCDVGQNNLDCVLSGAKYHLYKLQSCSWDCQSYDYCGDGKVNSTLKSDSKPYEDCEKSEACQIGYCMDKDGKYELDKGGKNLKILCENNEDCSKNQSPSCDGSLGCAYSANEGAKCSNDTDCAPKFACANFQQGKRYCNVTSEFSPISGDKPNSYKDATIKYTYNTCQWESENIKGFLGEVTCLPLSAPPPAPVAGICGDGIINDGKTGESGAYLPGHGAAPGGAGAQPEVCDKGAQNGEIPDVKYGKTGNYCAFGCGQVITVSGGFCGDKIANWPEYCDLTAAQSDYVCTGTTTACDPKNTSACSNSQKCVPSARWSEGAKAQCGASQNKVPADSFLTNCANTCIGSCKLPVCGDQILDPGEECDNGDPSKINGGSNGIKPVLPWSQKKTEQKYCVTTCKIETAVSEYCGDGELNGNENCDAGSNLYKFTDTAKNKCVVGKTAPVCTKETCVAICTELPVGTQIPVSQDTPLTSSITLKVVDEKGLYNSETDASQRTFDVYWNGQPVVSLNSQNQYQSKLTNLVPLSNEGDVGSLKLINTDYEAKGQKIAYIAIYASAGSPTQTSIVSGAAWMGNTSVPNEIYVGINYEGEITIKIK